MRVCVLFTYINIFSESYVSNKSDVHDSNPLAAWVTTSFNNNYGFQKKVGTFIIYYMHAYMYIHSKAMWHYVQYDIDRLLPSIIGCITVNLIWSLR